MVQDVRDRIAHRGDLRRSGVDVGGDAGDFDIGQPLVGFLPLLGPSLLCREDGTEEGTQLGGFHVANLPVPRQDIAGDGEETARLVDAVTTAEATTLEVFRQLPSEDDLEASTGGANLGVAVQQLQVAAFRAVDAWVHVVRVGDAIIEIDSAIGVFVGEHEADTGHITGTATPCVVCVEEGGPIFRVGAAGRPAVDGPHRDLRLVAVGLGAPSPADPLGGGAEFQGDVVLIDHVTSRGNNGDDNCCRPRFYSTRCGFLLSSTRRGPASHPRPRPTEGLPRPGRVP